MSPGMFILSPDEEILFGEETLPKGGEGAGIYVARLKEAQARLGAEKP